MTQCSIESFKVPHDLIASIEHRSHQLFIEVPEPWERVFGLSPSFPPKLLNVLQIFAKKFVSTSTSVFAPDVEYSDPNGGLRVIYLRERNSAYERLEAVLAPEEIADFLNEQIHKDVWDAKYIAPQRKDIFVCTHTNRDHCCGLFGSELYNALRNDPVMQKQDMRIFRCSHIGGHRYAPTLLESTDLRCWGHLNADHAHQILLQEGDVESIVPHYRGSALLKSPYMQVADREMLRKYGWDWFGFKDKIFSEERKSDSVDVSIQFTDAKYQKNFESLTIVSSEPVLLQANCHEDRLSSFPQFSVRV